MTREEAKAWFKVLLKDEYAFNSADREAFDMAIKALEQEPCEDAISRQAVLSMQYRIDDSATLSTRDVVNVDDIQNLPPVNAQPKTGHWTDGDRICPCCGEDKFKDLDADIWADWQPKFCPNCGAKMIEPKESEDKTE